MTPNLSPTWTGPRIFWALMVIPATVAFVLCSVFTLAGWDAVEYEPGSTTHLVVTR